MLSIALVAVAGACSVDERDLTEPASPDSGDAAPAAPDARAPADAKVDAGVPNDGGPSAANDGGPSPTIDAATSRDAARETGTADANLDSASEGAAVDATSPVMSADARADAVAPLDATAGDARNDGSTGGADAQPPPTPAVLGLTAATGSLANFGSVTIGTTKDETFVLSNSGQQSATITVSATGPGFSSVASATNPCGATLLGGGNCNITVRFSATTLDARTGSLGVAVASGTPPSPVALSATGVCDVTQMACSGICITPASDADNCGRCSHGCLTGGTCVGGLCQPISFVTANQTTNIVDIASDGNAVVWADSGDNSVDQVGSPGATKIVLGSSAIVSQPVNVGIDASSGIVFWAQLDGTLGFALRGMASSAALTGCSAGNTVSAINVASATIVDILSPGFLQTCSMGTQGVPLTGFLVADTGFNSTQVGKTLTPSWFVGDVANQQVLQLGPNGFPAQDIRATIPLQTGVLYLAEDASFVYWSAATGMGPSIFRASRAGAATANTQLLLANAGGTVGGLATDGVNVYYQNGSGIFYIPVSGVPQGAPSATRLTTLNGLFLKFAAGALYFASGGGVFKLATP